MNTLDYNTVWLPESTTDAVKCQKYPFELQRIILARTWFRVF